MRELLKVVSTILALTLLLASSANAGTDPAAVDTNTGANFNRYNYAGNSPYKFIDPDGREIVLQASRPSKLEKLEEDIEKIRSYPGGAARLHALDASDKRHVINATRTRSNSTNPDDVEAGKRGERTGSIIQYNPDDKRGGVDDKGSTKRDPFIGLAHELGHSSEMDKGNHRTEPYTEVPGTTPPHEVESLKSENEARDSNGSTPRSTYYPPDENK